MKEYQLHQLTLGSITSLTHTCFTRDASSIHQVMLMTHRCTGLFTTYNVKNWMSEICVIGFHHITKQILLSTGADNTSSLLQRISAFGLIATRFEQHIHTRKNMCNLVFIILEIFSKIQSILSDRDHFTRLHLFMPRLLQQPLHLHRLKFY